MAKKEEKTVLDQNSLFYSYERGIVKTPEFKEYWRNNQLWINCGLDNLYPQELLRLFLDSSSLHSALLRKKGSMTAGNGFNKEGLSGPALNFLSNRFSDSTLDQVAYAAGLDFNIFGGFYLSITWSKDGKSISRIQHTPFEKVRIAKTIDEGGEEGNYFYVSRDWEFYRRGENEPKKICSFNPLKAEEEPNQILFIKQYSPLAEKYCLPVYTSSVNFIKIAYEIGVYHLKNIQNGMANSIIIINKNGVPPAEAREKLYNEVKNRYTGSDNAGDVLMIFADKDTAPEIMPMPTNGSDERFRDLIVQVNENIRLAHDASPIVANIETAGALGSRTEIADAYDVFNNIAIIPVQKIICDTFNKLAGINGIHSDFELNKYNIYSTPDPALTQTKMYIEVKKD